jgi:predicted exporter/trans-aconitate methyltransferase
MIELLTSMHEWLAQRRAAVFGLLAVFVAVACWPISRLDLSDDFTDMLPLSDPAVARQFAALKEVREADRLFVDVGTATDAPEVLAEAADQLHAALQHVPGLSDLRYRIDEAEFEEVFRHVRERAPELLTADDLRAIEERLTSAAIEQRLAWLKKAMSQPQGMMLKDMTQADPIGLSDALAGHLRALQGGGGQARIVAGRITSPDDRHVLMSAAPDFPSSERRRSAGLLEAVLAEARKVEARFPADAVRVSVTGAHRAALDNANLMIRDATLTASIATVAVLTLMLVVYRRLRFALLTLTPPLFGGLTATAALALTGEAVSAIALGCGSILIGITDDYGNHVLYHTEEAPLRDRRSLGGMVARLATPLTFGALATMAAFLLMLLSPVAGHRQVGLFATVGVAAAAVFALVLLPLFIPVGEARPVRPRVLTPLIERLFRWRDRRARGVIPVLVALSAVCLLGVLRLDFEGDFSKLNGVTGEARRDDDLLREVWGQALSLTTLVVSAPDREAALELNERVRAALLPLQSGRPLAALSSIAPLLPAERTRQANRERWQAFWTASRRTALAANLGQAATKLGFRQDAFTAFLASLDPAARRDAGTVTTPVGLGRLSDEFVREAKGRVTVCTLAKPVDREAFRALQTAVLKAVPGALILNRGALAEDIARIARNGLGVFAGLVLLVNAGLLLALLGRVSLVAVAMLPVLAGLFWTLGTLGLCGVPISVSNFIFVIFVVGVSIDYSLFLVTAKLDARRGHPERTVSTGGSITACALTTWLGFGVLVLAKHPALFSIGLTAMLGISFCLLATLFLVPTAMDWLLRQESTRAEVTARTVPARRKQVGRLYRYQGPYVEQFVYWKMKTDPLFTALEEVVPPSGTILDLGCGYGMAAHWLVLGSADRTVVGLDHDEEKVRVARATSSGDARLRFEVRDLLEGEYPACDHVVLFDVLHYFPTELKARLLARSFAAMRPGGQLIVRDAGETESSSHRKVALAERWAVWFGQNKTAHGLHFESHAGHVALLEQVGFRIVGTRYDAGLGSNFLLIASKPTGSPAGPVHAAFQPG